MTHLYAMSLSFYMQVSDAQIGAGIGMAEIESEPGLHIACEWSVHA